MIIRSPSHFRLDHITMAFLLVALALVLPATHGAPVYENDQTEMENYGESTGCYYNYNHYGEGDRIMTNEPCLNCTCHDRMLMCYLRVCPFTKAIGQDCTIEKREDQCCPVITCPAVEVQLLDHQTTASPSTALGGAATSDVGALDQYGCSISGRFYPEGAQVPSNPQKPCELCYCIRNMTTCVMQECTLHIDGCQPIYNKGVCCPVRYDCDHDKDTTPMLEDELTTTVRPTPGFILTTTVSPSVSTDCVHNGETYADGALIMTDKPCEHCYCMRGDIVCAVQECGTPLENEGKNCVALPPAAGQCCPDKYMCDGGAAAPLTTTLAAPAMTTTIADDTPQEQQKLSDDQEAAPESATLQVDVSKATTSRPADDDSIEKEDDDNEQQQQQHVVPQFEDIPEEDGSEEEGQREDVQVPKKTDEEPSATTARPADDEVEHDHIPGHVGPHEHEEDKPTASTVAPSVDAPLAAVPSETTPKPEPSDDVTTVAPAASSSTVRPETSDKPDAADEVTTVASSIDTSSATVQADKTEKPESADEGTTAASFTDASSTTVQVTHDEVPSEQQQHETDASDDDLDLDLKISDEDTPTTPTTVHFDDSKSQAESTTSGVAPEEASATTIRPGLVPASDEKENEIEAVHDDGTDRVEFDKTEPSHDEKQPTKEEDKDLDEPIPTTPAAEEIAGTTPAAAEEAPHTVSTEKEPEHTTLSHREQPAKVDVTTEKKEPANKADDVPQPAQDFVELPPAVIVTELPPAPISEDKLSSSEQTLAPPKDEILPNQPLEADSHVLDDSTTTEYPAASDDHKKEHDDTKPQLPVRTADDFNEPVEMNTVITPPKDETQPQHTIDADQSEEQHQIEQEPVGLDAHESDEEDSEEEPDDEQEEGAVPTTPKSVLQSVEQVKDDENETTIDENPEKLFPESIPGEGNCLIDGVTYENGASVPASGKCQVICRCSNSIVHCEAVRCEPAPSDECTAKTILPGECCPTYDCPARTSSTTIEPAAASSEGDNSKDVSESADVSDVSTTEDEASISSSSTESSEGSPDASSTTSAADSQTSAGDDQEEDDESGKPSEAESDSAGFDLDNDVFKPLFPQKPMVDLMNINYFAGNRPTTADYDDEIVLSTAAPTQSKSVIESTTAGIHLATTEPSVEKDGDIIQSTVVQQNENDFTVSPTLIPAQHKPEVTTEKEQSEVLRTTVVAFDEIERSTAPASANDAEQTIVKDLNKTETSTNAPVDQDGQDGQNERATTPTAFVDEDSEQESSSSAPVQGIDQDSLVDRTTIKPSTGVDFEDVQTQVYQLTTVRSIEQTADAFTKQEDSFDDIKQQTEHPATASFPSSTDRSDEPIDEDQSDLKQESTTSRLSEAEAPFERATEQAEPEPVTEHKTKLVVTTAAPSMQEGMENEIDQASTTTVPLKMDEEVTQKAQEQEEQSTTPDINGSTASSIAADTTSVKNELEDVGTSTTTKPDQPAQGLDDKILEDVQKVQDTGAEPTTVLPIKIDDLAQEVQKSTAELPSSTTAKPVKENDGSIVFRDDEEAEPIQKPTLDVEKVTHDADDKDEEKTPTKSADENVEDDKLPTRGSATEDEKDDDNLISPVANSEQDGGFHFPQEKDAVDKQKPIFKPTLDETVQSTIAPESDDQVKEHDEPEQTSVSSTTAKTVEEIRTTLQPEPTVTKGQQPEKHSDENNEIDADLPAKPAVPAKGSDASENNLMYDEIDESEQQTNVPSATTPKEVVSETQRPELDKPTTGVPTTPSSADDQTEHTVPTVHHQQDVTQGIVHDEDSVEENVTGPSKLETSSSASTVPSATTTELAEAEDHEQEQQKPVQPLDDSVSTSTVQAPEGSSPLYEEKVTTAVSLEPEHDGKPSVDQAAKPLDDAQEVESPTTVSSAAPEQDDKQGFKHQEQPDSSDLENEFTTPHKTEGESDSEQVTTETTVSKQTLAEATERQTTVAPAHDEEREDVQTPLTDAAEQDVDDQQQQHSVPVEKDEDRDETTKVPVAHAGVSDSEDTATDDESQPTPTSTLAENTEASVKPSYDATEHENAVSDEDDTASARPTTASIPERDDEEKLKQPQPTESKKEKVAATTLAPAKADEPDQEPTLTTVSDDQGKQSTTVPAPVGADDIETESDGVGKPDTSENDTQTKEQSSTIAPSSIKPSADNEAVEASFDKTEEPTTDAPSRPIAHDETGDEESASATTVRAPVTASDDESVTKQPEPQEHVESEGTTASPTVVAHDDATESYEDDHKAQEADSIPTTSTVSPAASDATEDVDRDSVDQQKPAVQQSPVESKPSEKDEIPVTTTEAIASEPEHDQHSEEQTDEKVPIFTPVKPEAAEQDKESTITTAAPVVQNEKDSEEEDDLEIPQTDDLNADDDSSEEDNDPAVQSAVPTSATAQPTKAPSSTSAPVTTVGESDDVPAEQSSTAIVPLESVTFSTHAPDSDSQVTEQSTTIRQEEAPATEQASPSITEQASPSTTEQASPSTTVAASTTAVAADAVEQTEAPAPAQDAKPQPSAATDSDETPTPTTSVRPTTAAPSTTQVEQTTTTQKPASIATDKAQESSPTTAVPPIPGSLDDRFDDDAPQIAQKPEVPSVSDDKVQKPHDTTSPSDDEDEDEDEQQKVQEPAVAGGSKPDDSQPDTVGPSYGAPGQHYDGGYGHMPPHYPPSSYEEDYGEEEDPAAFGPGTCRYGGKLYVSAQQIPRDDPCDFCFCFRSDIICLQQSCPPPISGCNEEPISGFCCPRYECPVSMATVLNVTTSTTTTTTTLPPHFPSHAYKGQVQKRGCQIQGKAYNVGEMVASASGPCMRCTCGGDGQMQCEPKACSPEPMLQQMIAVAAARRR